MGRRAGGSGRPAACALGHQRRHPRRAGAFPLSRRAAGGGDTGLRLPARPHEEHPRAAPCAGAGPPHVRAAGPLRPRGPGRGRRRAQGAYAAPTVEPQPPRGEGAARRAPLPPRGLCDGLPGAAPAPLAALPLLGHQPPALRLLGGERRGRTLLCPAQPAGLRQLFGILLRARPGAAGGPGRRQLPRGLRLRAGDGQRFPVGQVVLAVHGPAQAGGFAAPHVDGRVRLPARRGPEGACGAVARADGLLLSPAAGPRPYRRPACTAPPARPTAAAP